jgi:hypothetical protein
MRQLYLFIIFLVSISTSVYSTGLRFRLAAEGDVPLFPFETQGLSGFEKTHRWTEGKSVSFVIPLHHEGQAIRGVVFRDTRGLISPSYSQTVNVLLNGHVVRQYIYQIESPSHTIEILFPSDLTGETAIVSFDIPNACVVKVAVPNSEDPRVLGVWFNYIEFITEAQIQARKQAEETARRQAQGRAAEFYGSLLENQRRHYAMIQSGNAYAQASQIRAFNPTVYTPMPILPQF